MFFSKVVAILDISDYELIGDELTKLNIPGVSVSRVHGFGDYYNEYNQNGFSDSMKIEIYTSNEQAEKIALVLSDLANKMTDGGGVVAVEPVTKLLNIKELGSD